METCKCCNKEFKNLKALSVHFNTKHNLSTKQYYDEYLKKDDEGICYICGGQTIYRNLGDGYLKHCSIKCRDGNKTINHSHWKGKLQPKEMIEKRIHNTNQLEKQKTLETTNFNRYGVNNISKLQSIKEKISIGNIGKILNRTYEWQKNIIDSKRRNGTLKHSDETICKITNKINEYYSLNFDREKYISKTSSHSFYGWYNGLHFRSSLELSFLVRNNDKLFTSCEKNKYKIIYEINGKQKSYYPDFTDETFIYEIKPTSLLTHNNNELKIKRGIEFYGDSFKVITEKECPYLEKTKIFELIECGIITVDEKSLKRLKKYRH